MFYFRARYYDASLGQFISRDPIGFVDGFNLYLGYFVPSGLDWSGFVVLHAGQVMVALALGDYNGVVNWARGTSFFGGSAFMGRSACLCALRGASVTTAIRSYCACIGGPTRADAADCLCVGASDLTQCRNVMIALFNELGL